MVILYFLSLGTWLCKVLLPYRVVRFETKDKSGRSIRLHILLFKSKKCKMKIENTQVQMRKGILEYCILRIISRGEVYASDMLGELTSAKIIVVEGTLYPLLTRLRKSGLVDYKWVESISGPPRKYYTLTDEGSLFLEKLEETWNELASSIKKISSKKEKKKKTQ